MAEEISNKTLAVIVVAAIVVTLGSTALILRMGAPVITGMATEQSGTAQFNISGVVSIDIDNNLVEFGAGSVLAGQENATMDTGAAGTGTCTQGNWSAYSGAGFVIENDGNVNINLTVSAGATAATFIGGDSPAYQWMTDVDIDQSATTGTSTTTTCGTSITSYTGTSTSATMMCSNFPSDVENDEVELDIQVTIPSDATVGQKSDTLTFEASAY